MRNPSHFAWISLAVASFTTFLAAQDPNVVVIISDDAGFADFGFNSTFTGTADEVPTPNLDILAARGVLCTNAYTAAVCSPSRAAITTGSYQNRIGYEYNINNLTGANAIDGLHPSTVTIFHRMKSAGYTTGAIGKWHIGARANGSGLGNRPENMDVDEFLGIWKGSRNYTVGGVGSPGNLRETIRDPFSDTVLESTAPWNTTHNYVTNAFGRGAVEFVDRHHADTEPFFLYVAFTAPHGPIGDSPDIGDPRISGLTNKRKQYASMMITMDKEIGRLMDKLADPLGDGTGTGNDADSVIDDTLIIFINDNGGASGNGTVNTPLRDWKGSTYEGGIRVPMILAGAGITATGGSTFDKPVHSIDILPTCLGAAGEATPHGIDGVNLLPYVNGNNPLEPHTHVIVRAKAKIGLRYGDWKLVKTGSSAAFQLFDLSTDLAESNNVAAANPALVEQLVRDATGFEAGFDKPRHAGLNNSADSINLNDRFVLDPPPPTGTFTPVATLVGGATLNGDFNAGDAGGVQTFALTPDWTNIGTGDQDDNATNTSQAFDTTRNGIVAESATREFGLDTGYTLVAGDAFRAGYVWKDASGWGDGNDKIRASLFTTSDNTITGTRTDIQGINSALSSANGAYQSESHTFSQVDGTVNGKRLFLSINAAQTGGGFARIDNVVLERGTIDTGGANSNLNWSAANSWTDHDTGLADTLLDLDSFPGCQLEFPVTNTFSYTATNNMTRPTGLEFMLNRLILSGTFAGVSPQSGTTDGNELMFTDDLSGSSPVISLGAIGGNFSFDVGNRLILYDDLVISGTGTAAFRLSGGLRDYFEPRSLTKTGSASLTVSGELSHGGLTYIAGGTFALDTALLSQSPTVNVETGATLAGNGIVNGQVTGAGTVAPGLSTGTLSAGSATLTGNLEIELDGYSSDRFDVAGVLDISATTLDLSVLGGGGTRPLYMIATYGSLTGTFATINGMPSGYEIVYDYDFGGTGSGIAIQQAGLSLSGTILIDHDDGLGGPLHNSSIRNGGLEEVGAGDTFADLAHWTNLDGDQSITASRTNLLLPIIGGDHNGVTTEGGTRQFAVDTGWTIREGDLFDLSFYWRDASGWNESTDTFDAALFTTDTDGIFGARSDLATFTSALSAANTTYQNEVFASPAAGAAFAGKRLFLVITPTNAGAGFARLDNVSLSVSTGTPPTAYETWTRNSALSATDSSIDADPNGDGVPNGVAFISGAPDAGTNAIPLLPTAVRDGTDLVFTFRRVADTAGLTAVVEYGSNLASWDTAEHGTAGITITEDTDGFAPGIDKVDVRLPATLASGEKLFARLIVE